MAKKNEKSDSTALRNVYLAGFMGSGKTTLGRLLARKLKLRFADSDAAVERLAGRPVAALVRARGWAAFRALEAKAVRALAAGTGRVVALGGGVYPSRRWRGLLARTGVTVFLDCAWPELEKRLKPEAGRRPRLAGPWPRAAARAKTLYARRRPFYRLADITVDTTGLSPAAAADLVRKKL
ncbi:MAG: shikimate kinase [Elusimicrobiales bacterium]|nr:shikimate kinase [Elusimicrobiales bacterium]